MLRYASLILVAGLLAGCASEGTNAPIGSKQQMAAFAASAQYPTTKPSNDLQATAVVNPKQNTIWIINPSNDNMSMVNVWVNQAFVARIFSVPAHSTVTIPFNSFYNQQGQTLQSFQTTVTTVQLESSNAFYTLLGPVFSSR